MQMQSKQKFWRSFHRHLSTQAACHVEGKSLNLFVTKLLVLDVFSVEYNTILFRFKNTQDLLGN